MDDVSQLRVKLILVYYNVARLIANDPSQYKQIVNTHLIQTESNSILVLLMFEEITKYIFYSFLLLVPCCRKMGRSWYLVNRLRSPYRLAIHSLSERGLNIKLTNFEITFLDYGSAGCTKNIQKFMLLDINIKIN